VPVTYSMPDMRGPVYLALAMVTACAATPAETSVHATFVASDGARLAYTIDFPAGSGPFPAVVLVHGSGRVTRHDHAGLSAMFTAHGWAQGTYSGVGVANSDTLIPLLGRDAAAAFRALAQSGRVDRHRIGFAGGSQAGWIIPVALGAVPDARLAVILSGPTVSVGTEIYYSNLVENTTIGIAEANELLRSFTGPYGFDPFAFLARPMPETFWLYGSDDRSIPTQACIDVHNVIPSSTATVRVYPGLGHALSDDVWADIYTFLDRFTARGSR
jgi:uncharacterized protein